MRDRYRDCSGYKTSDDSSRCLVLTGVEPITQKELNDWKVNKLTEFFKVLEDFKSV